jgi:hypothetical protein
VASTQLLDKVTKLKHQIDDGELDGKSNLYSEMQSTIMSNGKHFLEDEKTSFISTDVD